MSRITALLFFLLGFSFISIVAAQTSKAESFTIRGKVENAASDFWEFGLTGFTGNSVHNVPLNHNGSFSKTFTLSSIQDIYLYLNDDAITVFVLPGDTLDITWDEKKFQESFRIRTTSKRQTEIDVMLELYNKFRPGEQKFIAFLLDKKNEDSSKIERIKERFNSEIATLMNYPKTAYLPKIYCDRYYNLALWAFRAKLTDKFIFSISDFIGRRATDSLGLRGIDIKSLDENFFDLSPSYRDFIYDYVRFYRPFNSYTTGISASRNYLVKDAYHAIGNLSPIKKILDWFLAKLLIKGFEHNPFNEAEEAYQKLFPLIDRGRFSDTLEKFHSAIQKLKPGNSAPSFSLKDSLGNSVSLADLKDKIVYIDFWGVHCGPCIEAIRNDIPKLQEKYKGKDVVFLNVCVDGNQKQWLEAIRKYNFNGLHVLAEGWKNNKICEDYNINGIPHYVLIDKEGKIANNNASDPGQLNHQKETEIDRLLRR
jgi:thiol-disulfide isomerase/thioredoxin